MGKTSQMNDSNRAVCHALRNPPRGQKPVKLKDIRKLVWKKDGRSHPNLSAIAQAAKGYKAKKKQRGRRRGHNATSKAEDKQIMTKFFKLRPPGHGIDAPSLHRALPRQVKRKISPRTITRRLAKRGYTPQRKLNKSDYSERIRKRRATWCRRHAGKQAATWKSRVQAVGDLKDFTWYPKQLQARFKRLRAPWTYMTNAERKKPDFQRPKKWFAKKEWSLVKKQKVFGFTSSTGRQLVFLVPTPWTSQVWSVLIKSKLLPWLKRTFPSKTSYHILLDSEPVLHGPEARRAYREANITVEPGWPKYSPDLNPQEHVWSAAEPALRKMEKGNETFELWQELLVPAVQKYAHAEKLVGSMAKRIKQCIDRNGAATDY